MWIWFWLVNIPTTCSYLWQALAKRPPCEYHIFLARPQSSCTLEEKNLQILRGVFWLLQYLYDKHTHLHKMDKRCFYLFISLLPATSDHLEKLKCFNRSSWHIKFRDGIQLCWIVLSEHSTYLTRNINVPFPPSKCLSIIRLSINIFLLCQNMTRAADNYHILELKIDTKHSTKTLSITYWESDLADRAVARTLIGGGGVYSYIQVLLN